VSGNRTSGVMLHLRRAIVTSVPVVREGTRGLSGVRRVLAAVRVRRTVHVRAEHLVGLAGVRHEVAVQVPGHAARRRP